MKRELSGGDKVFFLEPKKSVIHVSVWDDSPEKALSLHFQDFSGSSAHALNGLHKPDTTHGKLVCPPRSGAVVAAAKRLQQRANQDGLTKKGKKRGAVETAGNTATLQLNTSASIFEPCIRGECNVGKRAC